MKRRILLLAALVLSCAGVAAPVAWAGDDGDGGGTAELQQAVKVGNIWKHLQALQKSADQNGGNRTSIFPGYTASVEYVADVDDDDDDDDH